MTGEQIIYLAKHHWIIFYKSIVFLSIGVFIMTLQYNITIVGIPFIILGIIVSINHIIDYLTSEFAVTNKRLILKIGFIKRNTLELFLTKVETIQIHQNILGRIFGFGTITIIGTGGTKDPYINIASPLKFRKYAQEQIAIIQKI
jgi:uncharacterized membrane protein YdbT with pleckstrin-like domain